MERVEIECPRCNQAVPTAEVNIQAAIARCTRCSIVFGIAGQVPGAVVTRKPDVALPKRFRIDIDGADLLITRRWFSAAYIALLVFCIFWDGFLVVWYLVAFLAKAPVLFKIFPLLHVAVGLGLTYLTLAGLLNRTVIRIGQGEIRVRHGPLPWPGNRILARHDVEQLYCTEAAGRSRGSSQRLYAVRAVLRDGLQVDLAKGLAEAEQALYIEQSIERHLGIEDRRMAGEMKY